MGLLVSRTWFIYARDASDRWMEPLTSTVSNDDNLEFHMGRFKHYVFSLSLGKLTEGIRKIYLYQGRRVARCERFDDKVVVTMSSREAMTAWVECKRSKLGLEFDKRFEQTSRTTYDITFTRMQDSQVVSR